VDEIAYEYVMELRRLYGWGSRKIANVSQISEKKVEGWLNEGYIPRGPQHFEYNTKVKEYVDGLIMGDGGVYQHGYGACFVQAFALRYGEWGAKIQKDLARFGIKSSLSKRPHNGLGNAKERYELSTNSYKEFLYFRYRWYPHGKKNNS
jgi:hypothetical protein